MNIPINPYLASNMINSSISSSYYSNSSASNQTSHSEITNFDFNMQNAKFVVIGLGLLVTLLALFGVLSLVKKNQPAPIFVINVFLSDVVQLCSIIPYLLTHERIYFYPYIFGVACSVGFMVCVSMERYLVIAWPLWYRFRRSIKTYVVICTLVWAVPLIVVAALFSWLDDYITSIIMGVFLLLPFPLLIFFLVGTVKALSSAINVPDSEKQSIVAISGLMLLIYTLLFLPIILTKFIYIEIFSVMATFLSSISPLANSVLYILLKKNVTHNIFTSCCKISNNQQTNDMDDGQTQNPLPGLPDSSSV